MWGKTLTHVAQECRRAVEQRRRISVLRPGTSRTQSLSSRTLPDTDVIPVERDGEKDLISTEAHGTLDEALDLIDLTLFQNMSRMRSQLASPQQKQAPSYQRAAGADDDAYIEEMCGILNPEEPEVEVSLREERETFHFRGSDYAPHDMPRETLVTPKKRVWLHHGDLLFFAGLVSGNFAKELVSGLTSSSA